MVRHSPTEHNCMTRSKMRRGNQSNVNLHKSAKCKKKDKNTWPWKQSKKASGGNKPHGNFINDRLTVPQKKIMQSGLYLKGESSGVYRRKNGATLNTLNEARMNEKVCDIITLAKKTDYRVQQESLCCNEVCNSPETYASEEHNYCYKYQPSLSSLNHPDRSFRENSTINNKSLSFRDEDGVIIKAKIDHVKETSFLNICNKNVRSFDDSSYTEYRAFIKHIDNICLRYESKEDFITSEKNSLKEKLRVYKQNNERKSTLNSSGPTTKSLNSSLSVTEGGNDTKETKESCLQSTNAHKIKKAKKNPNYLTFKKPQKIVFHTILGQKKHLANQIDSDNVLKCNSQISLPFSNALSPEPIALASQLSNLPPMKGTSLDPVNFLKNTLDNGNSPATDLSCELKFLEEAMESPELTNFYDQYSPPRTFSDLDDENFVDQNFQNFYDDHSYSARLCSEEQKEKSILREISTVSNGRKNYSPSGPLLFLKPALELAEGNLRICYSKKASTVDLYHFNSLNSSEAYLLQSPELLQRNLSSLYPVPYGFKERQLEGTATGYDNFWQKRRMF